MLNNAFDELAESQPWLRIPFVPFDVERRVMRLRARGPCPGRVPEMVRAQGRDARLANCKHYRDHQPDIQDK